MKTLGNLLLFFVCILLIIIVCRVYKQSNQNNESVVKTMGRETRSVGKEFYDGFTEK